MKKFDQELLALQKRLVEMGERTESMVAAASRALSEPELDVEKEIHKSEDKLDQMQIDIDEEVVRLLTVYTPVATDLRYALTVSHVTSSLERIGDQAVNIYEAIQLMSDRSDATPLPELFQMADIVKDMLHDAIAAYVDKNATQVEQTIGHDDLVDSLNDQVVRELLNDDVVREVLSGPKDIAGALAQILIARSMERIADQACNICEEVYYLVRGDDIRHSDG